MVAVITSGMVAYHDKIVASISSSVFAYFTFVSAAQFMVGI
jgi:hypothetical protein